MPTYADIASDIQSALEDADNELSTLESYASDAHRALSNALSNIEDTLSNEPDIDGDWPHPTAWIIMHYNMTTPVKLYGPFKNEVKAADYARDNNIQATNPSYARAILQIEIPSA